MGANVSEVATKKPQFPPWEDLMGEVYLEIKEEVETSYARNCKNSSTVWPYLEPADVICGAWERLGRAYQSAVARGAIRTSVRGWLKYKIPLAIQDELGPLLDRRSRDVTVL